MVIWRFVVLQAKLLESLSTVRGGGEVKVKGEGTVGIFEMLLENVFFH